MSYIRGSPSLRGAATVSGSLSGRTSSGGKLSGSVSTATDYDTYSGEYEITPLAWQDQTLNTANRICKENITVTEIPYYEVSNPQNGITVNIA